MAESCAVTGLFHVLVKTNDLDLTLAFYKSVLGLREAPRPAMGNKGAWLACGTPVGEQIIHVWAEGSGMGPTGRTPLGTGCIDHVSFCAVGHAEYRARFRRHGLQWREFAIPGTTLFQMFVYDPSGVQIELTFDTNNEPGFDPDIPAEHRYTPGEVFFDPASYPALAA